MVVTAYIVKTEAPKTGKPGDIVPIRLTAKQNSDWLSDAVYADTYKYLVFIDNILVQTQPVTLPNNQDVTSTINIQMPDKDLNARIELWFNAIKYIAEYKADETLISVAKGAVTSTPQEREETSVSFIDKLLSDTTTVLTLVLIVVVILLIVFYMTQKKR